jgi:cell volume regulation protein A
MAVFLGVSLLGIVQNIEQSPLHVIPLFFQQMILGSIMGWASGKGATWLVNRIKLEFEGLYPVLNIGWILLTYALTQRLGGSGFLAVYISGIIIGNANLLHRKSLIHFHEGIAWLGQIAMFLTMGLLVHPTELRSIAPLGIALSTFLVFIARPASVFTCFPGRHFNACEKLMISWAGLRGAVPIILASYVLVTEIPRAREIFNLVFFVTFFSVLLQGTFIPSVAKYLRVNLPFQEKFRFPIEFNPTQNLRNNLIEIPVTKDSGAIGKSLVQLNLPKDVLVVLIQRGGDVVVPRGGTHINDQDTLLILSDYRSVEEVGKILSPGRPLS